MFRAEPFSLTPYVDRLRDIEPAPISGSVIRVVGLVVESVGPRARVGEVCELRSSDGRPPLPVEVVGFRDGRLLTVPLGDTAGIRPGDLVGAITGEAKLTSRQIGEIRIAIPQQRERFLAFALPDVELRPAQRPRRVRVEDEHRLTHRYLLSGKRIAPQMKRVSFLAEGGRELVHHPARDADELRLDLP